MVYYYVMVLFLHIGVALASIVYATYSYLRPSRLRLQVSYAFATLTLGSGVYLVAMHPASIQSACVSGLVYLAVVSLSLFGARRKLLKLAAA